MIECRNEGSCKLLNKFALNRDTLCARTLTQGEIDSIKPQSEIQKQHPDVSDEQLELG